MKPVSEILAVWQQEGWLRALDRSVATMLLRNECDAGVALIAALTSYQVGRGHTCLSIHELAATTSEAFNSFELPPATWRAEQGDPEIVYLLPLLESVFGLNNLQEFPDHWQTVAAKSDAVAVLENAASVGNGMQPLIYDKQRGLIYLRRYWQYEKRISTWLTERMQNDAKQAPVSEQLLQLIQQVIPLSASGQPDWQRVACANAVKHSFSVITGGPGTGKTFTVIRVLATLAEYDAIAEKPAGNNEPLRIALAAPTGKAAARMHESINAALDAEPDAFKLLRQCLPEKASTLHRLLGSQRDSRYFRHNKDFLLPFDVVVVDEASMIDTEMFDSLLDALAPATRLILLGDKDQLAPVETGSILAKLCQGAEQGGYTEPHWRWLQNACNVNLPASLLATEGDSLLLNHVVMLRKSYRFTGDIANLANAVNRSDRPEVAALLTRITTSSLKENQPVAVVSYDSAVVPDNNDLVARLVRGFNPFVSAYSDKMGNIAGSADNWALQVLRTYSQYQCLTAVREGPYGQKELNKQFSVRLNGRADIWYHGRPVMVTGNDYSLNLFNGDIGVTLRHPEDGLLKVVFPGQSADTVRWVLPSRLAAVDTAYVMTVHKSQGSEFEHVVLILPDRSSPVLTKELVYTGITRAKQQLTLVIPSEKVWHDALTRRIERLGGLFN